MAFSPLQPVGGGFKGLLTDEGAQVGRLLHPPATRGPHELPVLLRAQTNGHLGHDLHLHVKGPTVK